MTAIRWILGIGVLGLDAGLVGDELPKNNRVQPWVAIVEVARGEKLDLPRLRSLSADLKFDWKNVITANVFGSRAVFIVDASGTPTVIPSSNPFRRYGAEEVKISPVTHFEMVLREFGDSIQELERVSGFEEIQTEGFDVVRTVKLENEK